MSRRSVIKECGKLFEFVSKFDASDKDEVLPPCNGIDRIIFQARFINRARKRVDADALSEVIEATKKSLLANLVSRPLLSDHPAVKSALSQVVRQPEPQPS